LYQDLTGDYRQPGTLIFSNWLFKSLMITKKGAVSMGKPTAFQLNPVRSISSLLLLLILLTGTPAGARTSIDGDKPYSTGTIGNFVWLDKDRDGRQDQGEPGIKGVTVLLTDPSGTVLATTITDSLGFYLFAGLDTDPSGTQYEVSFKLLAGYKFSPKAGVISDPGMNSDADEFTGKTGIFTLSPGQVNTGIDAGFISLDTGTLPLHTLELVAQLQDTKVTLKWVAENEMNTKEFFIQRSTDGVNYIDIGSKKVEGQINTPTAYTFVNDIQQLMLTNIIYYRIKAEDNIQRFAVSNIAPVRLSKITGIRVWPNPFVNDISISYYSIANGKIDVRVTDNGGRMTREMVVDVNRGVNQLSIGGAGDWPRGYYFISITERSTNRNFVQKIAK